MANSARYRCIVVESRILLGKASPDGWVDTEQPILRIERQRGVRHPQMSLTNLAPKTLVHEQLLPVKAFLGFAQLLRGPYMVIATKSEAVATMPGGASVHKVTECRLVAVDDDTILGRTEAPDEREFVEGLEATWANGNFYFCPDQDCDLTNSIQRLCTLLARPTGDEEPARFPLGQLSTSFPHSPASPRQPAAGLRQWSPAMCDARFFWNRHLCHHLLLDERLHQFVFPVMCGFVTSYGSTGGAEVEGSECNAVLVSRRSRRRQGCRFNVRGADEHGNVANFAETEQVCSFTGGSLNGQVASYVQTRGSIPVFWRQPTTMRYTPKVVVAPLPDGSEAAARQHFNELVHVYDGPVVCVNLVDKKGDQQVLGDRYERAVTQLPGHLKPRVHLEWFDFHHECRKMKWHNLSKLLDRTVALTDRIGWFQVDANSGQVLLRQHGCVRTNCMDNLDRTNVVQSLYARRAALAAVPGTGLDSVREAAQAAQANGGGSQGAAAAGGGSAAVGGVLLDSPYPAFERGFKHAWADNADAMSVLYSGTGALKTDFTRTGKRTTKGLLVDGSRSAARYLLANFWDGDTQDFWDLLLGKFVPVAAGSEQAVAELGGMVTAPAGTPSATAKPLSTDAGIGQRRPRHGETLRSVGLKLSAIGAGALAVGSSAAAWALSGVAGAPAEAAAGSPTAGSPLSPVGEAGMAAGGGGAAAAAAAAAAAPAEEEGGGGGSFQSVLAAGAVASAAALGTTMYLFTKKGMAAGKKMVARPRLLGDPAGTMDPAPDGHPVYYGPGGVPHQGHGVRVL